MKPLQFNKLESFSVRFLSSTDEGRLLEVVVIEAGMSKNRKFYPADVLREATPLFNNAPICAYRYANELFDHVPGKALRLMPEGFSGNVIGWITDARFDEGMQAVVAKAHISEAASRYRQILTEAYKAGVPIFGFSIDAGGDGVNFTHQGTHAQKVLSIKRVSELTLVTHPAAGGRVKRIVASLMEEEETMDKLKALLEALRKFPAHWREGFELEGVQDDAVEGLITQLLEANREKASKELASIDQKEDAKRFAEVAVGVAALQNILQLLAEKKIGEAMAVVQEMIAAFEKPSEEEPEPAPQGAQESFAIPGRTAAPAPKPAAAKPAAKPAAAQGGDVPKEDKGMEDLKAAVQADRQELAKERLDLRLEKRLEESQLPAPAKKRVREFVMATVDAMEKEKWEERITEAIKSEKDYLASVSSGGKVTGCGPSGGAVAGDDQKKKWGDAMYAMLSGQGVHEGTPAFTGLHESFRRITGFAGSRVATARRIMCNMAYALPAFADMPDPDLDEYQQHYADLKESISAMPIRLQEALATTDWTQMFGDSIRRALQWEFDDPPFKVWEKIVSDMPPLDDFRTNRRIEVGGFADLPIVGELGTYQEFAKPTDDEETYTAKKFGKLFSVSWESILQDDLQKLRRIPQMFGRSAQRTLNKRVLVTNLANNPTMGDSVVLIHSTHINDVNAVLSQAALTAAIVLMRNQTEKDSGERLFLQPKYLVVPTALEELAWELTQPDTKKTSNDDATMPNRFKSQFGIEPVVSPFQTVATDWFVVADPSRNPTIEVGFLGGRREPELFVQDQQNVGSVMTADKITYKGRFVFEAKALNHRSFAGHTA